MVHALLQAHRMLKPHGLLINVNYLSTPFVIEVRSPQAVHKVGWLLDRSEFADERSTFNALARVVADGYFTLEYERDFDYCFHGDGFAEFNSWLAEWWSTLYLPDGTQQQLETVRRSAGASARIVLVMKARMVKLRAA